jgi:hypothetical protein
MIHKDGIVVALAEGGLRRGGALPHQRRTYHRIDVSSKDSALFILDCKAKCARHQA